MVISVLSKNLQNFSVLLILFEGFVLMCVHEYVALCLATFSSSTKSTINTHIIYISIIFIFNNIFKKWTVCNIAKSLVTTNFVSPKHLILNKFHLKFIFNQKKVNIFFFGSSLNDFICRCFDYS